LPGLKFRKTNLITIIKESLSRLSHNESIAVRLKSSLDDEAVWIDHEEMATVFFDLERNAVEAMQDGGELTVSVEGDERQVSIAFTDSGVGIAADNISLLFTPFFTTKPVGDGTGLSLPQAFATVKAHHGDISIESNTDPGKGPTGTTVRITLPRRQILQDKQARMIIHDE